MPSSCLGCSAQPGSLWRAQWVWVIYSKIWRADAVSEKGRVLLPNRPISSPAWTGAPGSESPCKTRLLFPQGQNTRVEADPVLSSSLPPIANRDAQDRLQQHRCAGDVRPVSPISTTASHSPSPSPSPDPTSSLTGPSPGPSRPALHPAGPGQPGPFASHAAGQPPRTLLAEGTQPPPGRGAAQRRPG